MSQRSVSVLVVCFALVACVLCVAARASAPIPGANTGRLIEMRLAANPANYNGSCPTTIKFGGFITVCCGPNTVSYGVSRSDGGHGNGGSHNFQRPGTWRSPELTSWTLGRRGETFNGWVMIGSGNMKSNRAMFHLHCSK